MLIKITKKFERNQLTCIRDDGSFTAANLGPALPFHDIAHFVAEQTFKIENGFYGLIEKGYSIQQLSDPAVIKGLGFESWLAEILTRGLQTLLSGACKADQFIWQVTSEIAQINEKYILSIDEKTIDEMLRDYKSLIEKWNTIADGETLELHFSLQDNFIHK
jgi:hypothetical protein